MTDSNAQSNRSSRDLALDAMRTLAIILMAAAHATRLAPKALRPGWSPFILLTEPYIQALFLFLVGASIGLSQKASNMSSATWLAARFRRALQLYAVGVGMFLVQRSWQWPEALTAPGILSTIAASLLIFSAASTLSKPRTAIFGTLFILSGLFIFCDLNNIRIAGLTSSNAPLMPCILFAGFGALVFPLMKKGWKTHQALTLYSLALLTVVTTLLLVPFHELFSKPLGRVGTVAWYKGRGSGPEILWKMIQGEKLQEIQTFYYNMRSLLVPFLAASVVLSYPLMQILLPLFRRFRFLVLPGKYALGLYLFHLLLLGIPVVVLGEIRPFHSASQVNLTLFLVMLACWLYATFRNARNSKKRESV